MGASRLALAKSIYYNLGFSVQWLTSGMGRYCDFINKIIYSLFKSRVPLDPFKNVWLTLV